MKEAGLKICHENCDRIARVKHCLDENEYRVLFILLVASSIYSNEARDLLLFQSSLSFVCFWRLLPIISAIFKLYLPDCYLWISCNFLFPLKCLRRPHALFLKFSLLFAINTFTIKLSGIHGHICCLIQHSRQAIFASFLILSFQLFVNFFNFCK